MCRLYNHRACLGDTDSSQQPALDHPAYTNPPDHYHRSHLHYVVTDQPVLSPAFLV